MVKRCKRSDPQKVLERELNELGIQTVPRSGVPVDGDPEVAPPSQPEPESKVCERVVLKMNPSAHISASVVRTSVLIPEFRNGELTFVPAEPTENGGYVCCSAKEFEAGENIGGGERRFRGFGFVPASFVALRVEVDSGVDLSEVRPERLPEVLSAVQQVTYHYHERFVQHALEMIGKKAHSMFEHGELTHLQLVSFSYDLEDEGLKSAPPC